MKTKGKLFLVFLVMVILLIAGAGIVIYSQIMPASSASADDVRFEISQGDSVKKIALELKNKGLIKNDTFFYYFVRSPSIFQFLFKNETVNEPVVLKSGIYHLNASMNYAQIVSILSSGQQEYIVVSIPEGKTISQTGRILEENGICKAIDFILVCHDKQFLQSYSIKGESAEGFLFPDTYFLTSGMTAREVAELMIKTFYEKISGIEGFDIKTPEKLYETVILASIVEREYRVEEEAPLIASVFTNRLHHNIGLYSCATIVYILTEIEGRDHPDRILLEDTKIDSPYNTYKWAGLPPGPISNPGLVALKAAANPPKTDYYFFQVADANEGRHVFTSTFDEHKASHNLSTKR
ncbi:MAG: endolytic transglycosylase MltG [Treponema sp.]|nr:endolytic transglycosylase MltG [Treponema sp.]